jgi:hypothetical protein
MQPLAPSRPPRTPFRAQLTDRLLYTWERLRPAQRNAAWQMVENMRATVAEERSRRRRRQLVLSIALAVVTAADGVIAYLMLHAPAH